MTVVAIILLPVVLAYQSWTYYVFRRRISRSEFEPVPQPGTSQGQQPVITPDAAHPSPDGGS
jgi:cytochrome d ubiquinol oxidase subunit II